MMLSLRKNKNISSHVTKVPKTFMVGAFVTNLVFGILGQVLPVSANNEKGEESIKLEDILKDKLVTKKELLDLYRNMKINTDAEIKDFMESALFGILERGYKITSNEGLVLLKSILSEEDFFKVKERFQKSPEGISVFITTKKGKVKMKIYSGSWMNLSANDRVHEKNIYYEIRLKVLSKVPGKEYYSSGYTKKIPNMLVVDIPNYRKQDIEVSDEDFKKTKVGQEFVTGISKDSKGNILQIKMDCKGDNILICNYNKSKDTQKEDVDVMRIKSSLRKFIEAEISDFFQKKFITTDDLVNFHSLIRRDTDDIENFLKTLFPLGKRSSQMSFEDFIDIFNSHDGLYTYNKGINLEQSYNLFSEIKDWKDLDKEFSYEKFILGIESFIKSALLGILKNGYNVTSKEKLELLKLAISEEDFLRLGKHFEKNPKGFAVYLLSKWGGKRKIEIFPRRGSFKSIWDGKASGNDDEIKKSKVLY